MEQMPQELVDQISCHLCQGDLKNTLLLSPLFRFSAEKYSGAFNTFALSENNAQKFIDIFSSHRFLYLRSLEFWTYLPPVEYKNPALRDGAEQLIEHDKWFNRQIAFLFRTLSMVEKEAGDNNTSGKIALTIHTPRRAIAHAYGSPSLVHNLSWRVHLLQSESLPSLSSICSLEVKLGGGRLVEIDESDFSFEPVQMDYRVMIDLVSKFPNIDHWACRLGGYEWAPKWQLESTTYFTRDWAGPRRDARNDFAKSLESVSLPDSLQHVRLNFLHDMQDAVRIDHHTRQPNFVGPAFRDPFSLSLHHLSQQLRRLELRAVVDETLFWPHEGTRAPTWPNLERFVIMFHMVSPAGKWYFQGPKGKGCNVSATDVTDASYPPLETTDYDEEMLQEIQEEGSRRSHDCNSRFRVVPNDVTLRPFLAAFAKATSNMVSLKEAALWCPLAWDPNDEDDDEEAWADWLPENGSNVQSLAWGAHYLTPGMRDYAQYSKPLLEVPQLWWRVSKWRPDSELHQLFQQIGSKQWGVSPEEHWTDVEHGEKLVDLEYFECFIQTWT